MSDADLWRTLGFFALIAYLLWRHLPGALVFIWPGWIRARIVGGPDQVLPRGPAMREMLGDLDELGFLPLGVVAETRPLARSRRALVLASPEGRCFAEVAPVKNEAWLSLVTRFSDGAAVITSDFHRPSVNEPAHLSGGLPGGSPAELMNAHRRRVDGLVEAGHPLDERFTLEAAAEWASRHFAAGPGRREVRRREVRGILFTSVAVIWAGIFLYSLLRNLATG